MHFERKSSVRANGPDEVRKEQHGFDIVPVGDVDVKPLRVGLDALDLAA